MNRTEDILNALRDATRGTTYAGRLFLVGGFVRDKALGLPSAKDDLDIVTELNALELAELLWEQGIAQFPPVVYPRFGTAMIVVQGRDVELVTARIESYAPHSRKPEQVHPGTLIDDARRRDFTINTLLENLHTGELTDPLGLAYTDLDAQIIRTPTEPGLTFADDPLRMLRAVRFAARFGFTIAPETWEAIRANASRLAIISAERINDEFSKTLLTVRAPLGLHLLKDSGLLALFAPELLEMVGVTQNAFHVYDVWTHTLVALGSLPADASLVLRLATLFHDTGKPRTRMVDAEEHVHFYGHQDVSAEIVRAWMHRLKFSNEEIAAVTRLVAEHMRIGEYHADWTDSAVRRLIRDLGPCLPELFALHAADVAGLSPDHQDIFRAHELRARIEDIQEHQDVTKLTSPLTGQEIMTLLDLEPGKGVGHVKDYLTNEVVEGRLAPDDKENAAKLARACLDGAV
jgi:poly(A) polymerase